MKPFTHDHGPAVAWLRLCAAMLLGFAALAVRAAPGPPLVVIQLDTPGGPDTSMREVIQAILASRVPVAVYVEIKHIDLNESMVRAIARQAEAERERRAKVTHAEGEKQASAALLEAARMLAQQPEAMQLRYLQTMTQGAGDRAATVVLPLPLDLLGSLLGKSSGRRASTASQFPSSGTPG